MRDFSYLKICIRFAALASPNRGSLFTVNIPLNLLRCHLKVREAVNSYLGKVSFILFPETWFLGHIYLQRKGRFSPGAVRPVSPRSVLICVDILPGPSAPWGWSPAHEPSFQAPCRREGTHTEYTAVLRNISSYPRACSTNCYVVYLHN